MEVFRTMYNINIYTILCKIKINEIKHELLSHLFTVLLETSNMVADKLRLLKSLEKCTISKNPIWDRARGTGGL